MAITRHLGSGQDHVVKGSFQTEYTDYDYIAAMDGHGTGSNANSCISLLRALDFNTIVQYSDPVEYIHNYLKSYNLVNSGSTFTFARINKTMRRIEVMNVGDSMTIVIKNGTIIYKTPRHCFQNEEEIKRTKEDISCIRYLKAPFPVNNIDVYLRESNVGVWKTGENLVVTQCFGHNDLTGLAPSYELINYNSDDKIRVICATDGFWDMNMIEYQYLAIEDERRLINITERKWKQQWIYHDGENDPVESNFDKADDIGIAIWDN
jgi:hypothetical protein